MTTEYVERLVKSYPVIREVWLIGSRASETARPDSDWDYIAFANREVLIALASGKEFDQLGIDLLVVFDGDNFQKPWPDGDREKRGSLTGWQWDSVSDTRAQYRATAPRDDDGFCVQIKTGTGLRVFPR